MGYNPSYHRGPDLPVENVTWWEAIRYCNLRSITENLEPCFNLTSNDPCPPARLDSTPEPVITSR